MFLKKNISRTALRNKNVKLQSDFLCLNFRKI